MAHTRLNHRTRRIGTIPYTKRFRRTLIVLMSAVALLLTIVIVRDIRDVGAAHEASVTIDPTQQSFGNLNTLLNIVDGTSGIMYSRQNDGVLWALTDQVRKKDGGNQTLFAIDPVNWRLISAYTVTDSAGELYSWEDFEDMAIGEGGPTGWYLYLYEDVGSRSHVVRIVEPVVAIDQPTNTNATIAVDRDVDLIFPAGSGPEIETLAIDPATDSAYLIERRREDASCARTKDNSPNATWRIDNFQSSFGSATSLAMVATNGLVARPSGVNAETQNIVGAGDISADGFVFGVASSPRAGTCNRDAYVTLRTRVPGESWDAAISRQVQLPVGDERVTTSFTAEAFALAPDMSHLVYAPEWGGWYGRLYFKTLEYTPPSIGDDTDPPAAFVDFAEGSTLHGAPAVLGGTATDNAAVAGVQISVSNSAGEWLQADGSFGADRAQLEASLGSPGAEATTWSYAPFLVPDNYLLNVHVVDAAQNTSDVADHGFQVVELPTTTSIVLSAGDIGDCGSPGDEQTADLLASLTVADPVAAIATLGDTVYPNGSTSDFANCWTPTWGQFETLIHPAVGNHEYLTPGASGYFGHFGSKAGNPGEGYYSYDIDDNWHAVVLSSECSHVPGGGCGVDSQQVQWLHADLEANTDKNILAYWHKPRFSKNAYNDNANLQPFWEALSLHNAELVLAGHEHHYERYQPLDANGLPSVNGIRQFIVGTGGTGLRSELQTPSPFSETRNHNDWGVLKLTLETDSYSWEFVPVAGGTYTDAGTSPVNTSTPPPTGDVEVVEAHSDWKYNDSGDDLGTAWQGSPYDDSSWANGAAELGYGDGDEATVTSRNGLTTYFRQTFTIADARLVTALTAAVLRDDGYVLYLNGVEAARENMPAGAIAYDTPAAYGVAGAGESTWAGAVLNPNLLVDGTNVIAVEIHQISSGSSDISFDLSLVATLIATPPPPDTDPPSVTIDFVGGTSFNGPNLDLSGAASDNEDVATVSLSVSTSGGEWLQTDGGFGPARGELGADLTNANGTLTGWSYQASLPEGDYELFVTATDGSSNTVSVDNHAFSVTIPVFDPVLIDRGAVWKYDDSGNDLGTAWQDPGYDDGSWSSGPAELGFGDRDEATTTQKNGITTYFRKSFEVADASAFSGLTLEIVRDDGAVVYLNGVEVFRTKMPSGTIRYDTEAGHVNGNAERQWHPAAIDPSLLVDGTNVISVEIHNNSPRSSDISFNFYLEAS